MVRVPHERETCATLTRILTALLWSRYPKIHLPHWLVSIRNNLWPENFGEDLIKTGERTLVEHACRIHTYLLVLDLDCLGESDLIAMEMLAFAHGVARLPLPYNRLQSPI